MVTTTISETEFEAGDGKTRRQYRTTVPKQLVEAFDLGGKTVEWEVESSTALTIRVVGE